MNERAPCAAIPFRRVGAAAVALPLTLATASCGLFGGVAGGDGGGGGGGGDAVELPEAFTRDAMLFNSAGENQRARVEVVAVESTDGSSAVHLDLTNLGETAEDVDIAGTEPFLFDPVGGTAYPVLRDGPVHSAAADAYGSHDDGAEVPFFAGAVNEMRLYYPPLPEEVEYVTFVGLGAGAMTGIPVDRVDGHRPVPDPGVDGENREPEEGERLVWPVREPDGGERGDTVDTVGLVEGGGAAVSRNGDQETIALDADVLFAFDEAELTDEAAGLLAGAAEAVTAHAVGGGGILTVTGHSDGVGEDAYNRELSEERARVVREELEPLLGDGFDFEVSGKGSAEPVVEEGGADDEEARRLNRRVELSYTARPLAGAADRGAGAGAGLDVAERHVAAPASYRADPGRAAAELEHGGFTLSAYPLVRDGAHVIAEFDLANTGAAPAEPDLGGQSSARGSSLNGFRLEESSPELTRYPLVMDVDGEYRAFAEWAREIAPGEEFRLVVVFPAPSEEAGSVSLEAGPFGAADLPIE